MRGRRSPRVAPTFASASASGQQANGDLRLTAVKRQAERTTANIPDLDDVAGFGADVDEVAAVNPRVTASKTILTARGDDNRWNSQGKGPGSSLQEVPSEV